MPASHGPTFAAQDIERRPAPSGPLRLVGAHGADGRQVGPWRHHGQNGGDVRQVVRAILAGGNEAERLGILAA